MDELQRQRDLLRALSGGAIAGLREQGARAARGLEAYRANAEASAERALAAAFATVQALVGVDDFRRLACEFWHAHPPRHGDLGEWGEAFPAWLAAHAALAPWPYLSDSARLDFALHRSERAADAVLDAASLSLLESTDPSRLQMVPAMRPSTPSRRCARTSSGCAARTRWSCATAGARSSCRCRRPMPAGPNRCWLAWPLRTRWNTRARTSTLLPGWPLRFARPG
jgi:hypothetical protein